MKIIVNNKKLVSFIVMMQEAFSAIIPFFLLSSFFSLLYFFINYYSIDILFINTGVANFIKNTFDLLSSVVINISIAYFFAIRIKISQIMASLLSIATFTTIASYEYFTGNNILFYGFSIAAVVGPLVSTYFLKLYYPKFSLNIFVSDGNFHIYRHFNYIFVFFFAYITTVLLYIAVDYCMDFLFLYLSNVKFDSPLLLVFMVRDFFIQVFWFFGLHGNHMYNTIAGKEILFQQILPNLTFGEFNSLFVAMGGSGIGVGLLIAILLYAKEKRLKFIAKLSIPFVPFNINTLLIYSTVVLNRYLILPFIFLPILNILVAYTALCYMDLHFMDNYLPWTAPIFVNSFLKVQEYGRVITLQVLLIMLDTVVYIYFIKKFTYFQSPLTRADTLMKNLELTNEIKAKEGLSSFVKRQEIIEANAELDHIIETINNNNLYIYYQPKVISATKKCNKFEALIRYDNNGKLTGPIFLDTLEKAGLASIVDMYVCEKVKEDMDRWFRDDFKPQISINLHPDTLKSNEVVEDVIKILKEKNIVFEIIERSLLEKNSEYNLKKLKKSGFGISIDDFGAGYSSFETTIKYDIDELKIDKSLIDIIDNRKSYLACKHITNLCHEMGVAVVAEGVETKEQLEKIDNLGVDIIQGFYFSKAIPFEDVKNYTPRDKITKKTQKI